MHIPAAHVMAAGGGLGSTAVIAADESPLLAGAPAWVHIVIWAGAVIVALVGVLAAVRKLIGESDIKTAAVSAGVVATIRADLDTFRKEQEKRNAAVSSLGPRLVSIDSTLRDVGDVRGELQGMAFQVGELGHRVGTVEQDISAFHKWKREHLEEHKKGDALLKMWAKQMEERNKASLEATPPTGWEKKP